MSFSECADVVTNEIDANLSTYFSYWFAPQPNTFGETVQDFLECLKGPTHIEIPGEDTTRCRVVVTLLHGNEPSGLYAILQMIQQEIRPAVTIHCFIPNVATARVHPTFYYRHLPDFRDLNRCFGSFINDQPGILAHRLLDIIKDLEPECAIDIHNTSGTGPAFGVATHMDNQHDALVSLFTSRLVVTDLKLGALMEISDVICPTVTIECGGAKDEHAKLLAVKGMERYFVEESILTSSETTLDYFHNPIRLELKDKVHGHLAYGDDLSSHGGVTLKYDIEKYNFSAVTPDDCLGFMTEESLKELTANNSNGDNVIDDYFCVIGERLYPKRRLKFFMITANATIARTDCLLYFVSAD